MAIEYIRPDFLFSYWIYAWFILYFVLSYFDNVNTFGSFIEYGNPSLALWFALLENVFTFLLLISYSTELSILIKYAIMMLMVKVFPLYLLQGYNVQTHFIRDFQTLACVFIVYNVYLLMNHVKPHDIYRKTFDYVKNGDIRTPMFRVFDFLYSHSL